MSNKILAICLDCGDTLIDEATEVKDDRAVSLRAQLIPGADSLIRQLKARGYPLALVADGPVETFVNNLGPYDLLDVFDVRSISENLGVEKPHPRMFSDAVEKLGIAPENYGKVVMVGNNLERDIWGANRFGLISVWIDWAPRRSKIPAHGGEQPRFTIKTPLALLDILDRLEQDL